MKLRSSLDSFGVANKFTGLLMAASLILALSANPKEAKAQEKDKQSQGISLKEKYFTQLVTEIQREMKMEEETKFLENNKESIKTILVDFRNEKVFVKEKKEEVLDKYLEQIESDIKSIKSVSQLSSFLDKNISFLNSLKQKTVVIGQEKVSAGEKEISFAILDVYINRLNELKLVLSKKQNNQEYLDLLSMPSIVDLLKQAKDAILKKEGEYTNQIAVNDSLKLDYSQLVQSVYDLEKNISDITTKLQEKNINLEINQKELATYEALGTNINESDFSKKVNLVNVISQLKKEIEELTKSLQVSNAELVVKSNQIPVKEVNIDQNIRKLGGIQKSLLDEKNKQYAQISASFRKESTSAIDVQDKEIDKQMLILKKSIANYNSGIDSLTNVLQKINEKINEKNDEQISVEFGNGENVIRQREIRIQGLLKEHVKYSQELEKLYLMYKMILLQNKEAIIKLEQNNPFIKTDISVLELEKEEMERLVESLRVNISSKEKEKSETKDDARIVVLINELTLLYANLQRAETALKQTQELLLQRKSFDTNYSNRKNQEVEQIDKTIEYIDNNISASRHAIGTFVYGYYMQLKKMEIQNLKTKISGIEKSTISSKNSIESKTNEIDDIMKKIELNRRSNLNPSEILSREKKLRFQKNFLISEIESLKSVITKNTKLLEEYNLALVELQKTFKEFALLAKEDLDAYCDFSFNGLGLIEGLKNSNYPLPKKLPMDISDFATIEKLINLLKESGLQPNYSIEDIKKLYSK